MFKYCPAFLFCLFVLIFTACGTDAPADNKPVASTTSPEPAAITNEPTTETQTVKPLAKKLDGTLTVYTDQNETIDQALFTEFEAFSGIKIKVVAEADSRALVQRLKKEGQSSPADMILLSSMNELNWAKAEGLLQKLISVRAEAQIPEEYRDEDRHWFGLTRNATVAVYLKEQVTTEQLSYYEYLSRQDWKGKLLLPTSEHPSMVSLLASILAWDDLGRAEDYFAGFVSNLAQPAFASEAAALAALAKEEGVLALVSTRAAGQFLAAATPAVKAKLAVFYPKNMGGATHFDLTGIGFCKSSQQPDLAAKLVEFLSNKAIQARYSAAKFAYPANTMVQTPSLLKAWGTYHGDDLPFTKLYQQQAQAKTLFKKVGW